MKFWVGGAAEMATMAVIWAQLIVKGVSQGPHPFIVHLRCSKTHQVLPGITLGDVGPKNGANYIDNGFIILDNICVPKENLLGKVGRVNQNGDY
jgi:alkylation response protein AidB-like acyl-CoA dehydrogenase